MNRPTAPTVLMTSVMGLTLAAGLVLATDRRPPAQAARSDEFQRLVGGLGFGPATFIHDCPYAFDPRLAPGCTWDAGPVPGGSAFCPHHAGSVFYYGPRSER